MNDELRIYISYAGNSDEEEKTSENLVEEIKNQLMDFSVVEYKDKSTSGEEYNLEEFIEEIGTAEYVIVIVSEKYLTESEYCQKEIKRIMENARISKRIFPIFVKDFPNIYDLDIKNNLIKKAHQFINTYIKKEVSEREKIAFSACKNTTEDFISELKEKVNWTFKHDQVNELIEKIKTTNISSMEGFTVTNKPRYIETQYKNDVFRESDYQKLAITLSSKQNDNILFKVYGAPGVGKSSFMASTFNALPSERFQKIIYFIEGHNDYLQHLESLYIIIKDNLSKVLLQNNISSSLENIRDNEHISSKIEQLLNMYSKRVYSRNNKQLVLMIDALDTLNEEDKFMIDLIKNYEGIHFILSGRKHIENKIKINLMKINKGLTIYQNNNENGMLLENLSKESTYLYFDNNQLLDNQLTIEQINNIREKIYHKSNGLPKYFELLVNKLNKYAFEYHEDMNLYEKLHEYISRVPKDLEASYLEEFRSLEDSMELPLEILTILYWSESGLTKEVISILLEEKNINDIDHAIDTISYLIQINDDKYEINHLSIKEALFSYFQLDKYKNKTAIRLEQGFVKKAFDLETPILKYLANNEEKTYDLFSSIYYYDEKNILFKKLKHIIEYVIRDKDYQKDKDVLKLYYQFSKILYAQDMISSNILAKEYVKVTDLFTGVLREYTKSFLLQIVSLYSNYSFNNIYDLNKILSIAIMTKNYYFISKYFREYTIFKYKKVYIDIFSKSILGKKEYSNLDSMLSKMYVSMRWDLLDKDTNETLSLYKDDGLTLYYDNTISKDKHQNTLQLIKENVQSKKQRQFLEAQGRYYQTVKHSRSINFRKYFYNNTFYYAKRTNKLNEKMKLFFSQLAYDLVIENIESFNTQDIMYKYLPQREKQKINTINQLFISYTNNGLEVLLNTKNLLLFDEIVYFIKEEDCNEFLSFYVANADTNILSLIGKIIRIHNNNNVLDFCKELLLTYKYTTSLMYINLAIIYYKQKDLENLERLEDAFIQLDFERVERSFIQNISNTIDTGLIDVYSVLKDYPTTTPQFLTKYLQKSKFSMNELELFEEVIRKSKPEGLYNALTNISFYIQDNKILKRLLIQYKNELDHRNQNLILLNIIKSDDFEMFIEKFKNFDNPFQIQYLIKFVIAYIENKEPILNSNFWTTFFTIIQESDLEQDTLNIMQKVFQRNDCIDYCKAHQNILEQAYYTITVDKTSHAQDIKSLLYKLILNVQPENEYYKLIEQDWIEENVKSRIATSLIYHMNDFENMLALSNVCIGLDKSKTLIDIGLTCVKPEQLKKGVELLYEFKNISNNNVTYFNNYLQYTLPKKLDDENTTNFITETFIPYSSRDTLLTTFLNMEKFNSSNEFFNYYIKSPKKFLSSYLSYILHGNKIDIDVFNSGNESILDNLAILFDQYKLAEKEADGHTFHQLEQVFSEFKTTYKEWVDVHYDNSGNLTLDNVFLKLKEQEPLLIDLIKTNYPKFHDELKKKYNIYMEAIDANDTVKVQEELDKFDLIIEEIISSDNYMDILIEKSFIPSELALKLDNIDLFAPK